MKTHEKLTLLIREKGINLKALHRKICEQFEDKAIAYLTLYRTVRGLTEVRESTVFQIASALGLRPEELAQGTDRQEHTSRYIYNKSAYLEIDNTPLPFLSGRLVLLPGAQTQTEQDPTDKGTFIKWLYGLQGEMTCVVESEQGPVKITLRKHERFSFPSTRPHHFENTTNRKAACILIQNPKYI